jgi:hypothetical protein
MMDARLQRRIQRYGWDLAAVDYESLWQAQLAEAQDALLALASPAVGERVLDIACGTGLVSFEAARAVGPSGHVLGIDLSERMVDAAERRARDLKLSNCRFSRMDAETLALPDASFDVVLCALGLMYMPDPEQALREMYGYYVQAVAYLSPYGANDRSADGQRSFRLLTTRWPAKSVRCSFVSDSKTLSRVCAPMRSLSTSDTVASQQRSPSPMPTKLATRRLSAVPSHSRGRASMMRSGRGFAPATWTRSSRGGMATATESRGSLSSQLRSRQCSEAQLVRALIKEGTAIN